MAQNDLLNLREQPARNWVVDPTFEWEIYRKAIRESGHAELARAGCRFGWQVLFNPRNSQWQIRLLAPDRNFIWSGSAETDSFVLERNPSKVLASLYRIAEPLGFFANRRVSILEEARNLSAESWYARAEPRLEFNQSEALDSLSILVTRLPAAS